MDKDIKRAEEKTEYLSSDPQALALYKARERSLHERANMINSAKEEGIVEGIEQGEMKKAIETARTAITEGLPIEMCIYIHGTWRYWDG